MTKVTVNTTKENTLEIVHKVGNWYKHANGDIYILSFVEEGLILIEIGGSFWAEAVSNEGCEIMQEDFYKICGGIPQHFTLINNVEINIS